MLVQSKFRPSWWLRNPHLQTLWASKFRRPLPNPYTCERLELADGDFIDLAWNKIQSNTIVCLFHGLSGCVHSAYINRIMVALSEHNVQCVLMHFRGCSGEPNRKPKSYHSGQTEDIRFIAQLVKQRYPKAQIKAIGYSLGGNALLKYLAEDGNAVPLQKAIIVSPPLVLQEGAKRMNSGISRIYQHYLLGLMRKQHERKRTTYPELKLPEAPASLDTFWRFDDAITAPLHGFTDVHHYYTECSTRQYLSSITTQSHILFSQDDPFFTPKVIPTEDELGPHMTFELAEYGGHVGFISGANPLQPHYWLESRLLELLELH